MSVVREKVGWNGAKFAMGNDLNISEPGIDVVLETILDLLRADLAYFKLTDLGPDSDLVELVQKYDAFLSLDFEEFIWNLEERLNIRLTHEDIREFFGPMWERVNEANHTILHGERSRFSVAVLADFIRCHTRPVSFEPVSVLGSPPCPAAGYFVGMSELVQQVRPEAERFGPSTPITQVLPSHSLATFWRRLSRAAGRSLPKLSFWLNRLANVLLIGSAVCLLFGVFVNWAFLAAAWMLCLKGILLAQWLYRRANPLPQGIVTFGDLARHLAGQKEIPAPNSLSRRAGAWFGRTFLRRRSPAQTDHQRGFGKDQSSHHRSA